MRCPKCGYISFDHLEECIKCKKNIKETAIKLHGSVYRVAAPAFLQIQPEDYDTSGEPEDLFGKDLAVDDDEYLDEDLDILVESPEVDDTDQGPELTMGDDQDVALDLSDDEESGDTAEDDYEEDGIEIDLSQFEDTLHPEMSLDDDAGREESKMPAGLEIPDELADLSDLAPPGIEPEIEADQEEPELNLDDLDFDLGMDIPGTKGSAIDSEKVLSLDEIDFDEALSDTKPARTGKQGMVSMDDDLDFELDLGGLSIHKDE